MPSIDHIIILRRMPLADWLPAVWIVLAGKFVTRFEDTQTRCETRTRSDWIKGIIPLKCSGKKRDIASSVANQRAAFALEYQ